MDDSTNPPEEPIEIPYDKPWPEIEDLPTPKYIEVSANPEQAAFEIFRAALPDAAWTIANLSSGKLTGISTVMGTRLKAATIVVERVLGKVKEGSADGWDDFLAKITGDIQR